MVVDRINVGFPAIIIAISKTNASYGIVLLTLAVLRAPNLCLRLRVFPSLWPSPQQVWT